MSIRNTIEPSWNVPLHLPATGTSTGAGGASTAPAGEEVELLPFDAMTMIAMRHPKFIKVSTPMIFLRLDLCRSCQVESRREHVREGADLHGTIACTKERRAQCESFPRKNSRSRHPRPGRLCLQAEGTWLLVRTRQFKKWMLCFHEMLTASTQPRMCTARRAATTDTQSGAREEQHVALVHKCRCNYAR